MSAEHPNPAATPTPCEDIQGDGRWMSLVCGIMLYFLLLDFSATFPLLLDVPKYKIGPTI